MRSFHTRKLYIPDRGRFDECQRVYRERYGEIPISITVARNIVQWVTGWEVEGHIMELDGRAFVMPGARAFQLLVNSKTPPWQRRADVAHELAHILHTFEVHGDRIVNITNGKSDEAREQEERICDEIGAGLLCPEWALDDFVSRAVSELGDIDGCRLISRLSRQFQFPRDEMEAHLRRHYEGQSLDQIIDDAKRKVH